MMVMADGADVRHSGDKGKKRFFNNQKIFRAITPPPTVHRAIPLI